MLLRSQVHPHDHVVALQLGIHVGLLGGRTSINEQQSNGDILDNGAEFQSRFHWHLEQLDIQHVYIRPRTPRLNGKIERSHRVDDQEFYQLLDKDGISDDIHLFNEKLREWENYYNYHRPHTGLDGQTPYERLLAKMNARTSPRA
jgi:transposase InsO family protein